MAAPAGGKQNKCCRNQSKPVRTSHATVGCLSRQHIIQTHGCVNRSHTKAKSNRWNGLMGQPRNGDGTVFPFGRCFQHGLNTSRTPAGAARSSDTGSFRINFVKQPSHRFCPRQWLLQPFLSVGPYCLKHRHCQKDGQHNHDNGSKN